MTPTISGSYYSTCSRRVLVVAAQYGLEEGKDFTFNNVEFPAIKTPEWIAKQPFGQMPLLEDGDFVLYESRAIARYLANVAGALPTDPKKLALLDQAISCEGSNFDVYASVIAFEKVFKGMHGAGPADEEKVAGLTKALAGRLQTYDVILGKQKYLAGNDLTIADLFHLPYGKMVVDLGNAPSMTDGSLPNVARWWKEISTLPSWKKANEKIQ